MNVLKTIVDLIMKDIVGQPALLVGLIAVIGLILQKKSFATVLAGGVKTAVGYLIIQGGAGMVVAVLSNTFSPLVQGAFGLTAPAAEAGGIGYTNFLNEWGGYATVAVALGFVINLLLARITPFKYIYLTGHLMIFIAENIFVAILAGAPNTSPGVLIVITGILCGVYWTLQPAYMNKLMQGVTGTEDLAYGHTSSFNCWLAAKLGKFVGKPEESAEDIEMPEALEFFKDTTVSLGFVLGLVTFVITLIAGPSVVEPLSGGVNWVIHGLMEGLRFGAGITVMLYGVRMIIGELVPAFRGLAKSVVPGAKPALDCPIVFPYAPTAVLIGFVGAFVSFLIWMVIFGAVGWGVIIPPMIMLFFPGGAGGVFGNSTGGWKGAILGGVICGTLLAFGQLIVGNALMSSVPYYAMRDDPDVHILNWILVQISGLFGG
jgi:PTS system ascorbate-specific IIC component